MLLVFVYGTLKRGHANHHLITNEAVTIKPATIAGRLFDGPGFPYMVLANANDILEVGTGDLQADARIGNGYPVPAGERGTEIVHGELVEFADARMLERLDHLEGCNHGDPGASHYHRVLTRVDTKPGAVTAWTYVAGRWFSRDVPPAIPGGNWTLDMERRYGYAASG